MTVVTGKGNREWIGANRGEILRSQHTVIAVAAPASRHREVQTPGQSRQRASDRAEPTVALAYVMQQSRGKDLPIVSARRSNRGCHGERVPLIDGLLMPEQPCFLSLQDLVHPGLLAGGKPL